MPISSIQSTNLPGLFVRHRGFLADLTEIHSELDRFDGTFRNVPGLVNSQATSFESVNFPDHFLRHQDSRLKLHKRPFGPERDLFDHDATFDVVPGLAGGGSVSFRSANFPDRFMRHRDFNLFVEAPGIGPFTSDASFILSPPLANEPVVTLRYRGLNCFDETSELSGSDEVYLFTIATTMVDGQVIARTEKHPAGLGAYESVDAGRSFDGPLAVCYHGPARDLSLSVILMENDEGDPNAFKSEIDAAVAAAALALAGSTGVKLPEIAQQLVGKAVGAIIGAGDDLIGQVPMTLPAGMLLDEARKPRLRERKVEYTFFTDHVGDGGHYKAYFDVIL